MSFWFHRLDKITNEIISEFLPWNFLYLPGGFLVAFLGFLQASLFIILHTKSPGSPKSLHEVPRKLQKNSGQKSRNYFVGIYVQTMKSKGYFEINWPLVRHFYSSAHDLSNSSDFESDYFILWDIRQSK